MTTYPSEPPRTISAALRAICEHVRHHGYQLYPIEFFKAVARSTVDVPEEQKGYLTAAAYLLIEDERNGDETSTPEAAS